MDYFDFDENVAIKKLDRLSGLKNKYKFKDAKVENICNCIFTCSSSGSVIREGLAVKRFKLASVLPNSILVMVRCRIADKKGLPKQPEKTFVFLVKT